MEQVRYRYSISTYFVLFTPRVGRLTQFTYNNSGGLDLKEFHRSIWAIGTGLFVLIAPMGAHATSITIAAAANLQPILTESLIPAFEAKTGITVTSTFGSTKLLATQLESGAPDDVFVSADTPTIDKLVSENLLDSRTERVYAIGRLVLWTRSDAAHHPGKIQDLSDPAYQKIAIANPLLAPYGLAAQQSFASAGLTSVVASRIVQAENIGGCVAIAKSGNADVALTALSLVIEDKTDPYVIVPDKLHAPITQSAAVVKSSAEPAAAEQFISFLTSKQAAPIWKKYGYLLPKKQGRQSQQI